METITFNLETITALTAGLILTAVLIAGIIIHHNDEKKEEIRRKKLGI